MPETFATSPTNSDIVLGARIASTARRRSRRAKSRRATRCRACPCIASTCACRRTSTCRAAIKLTGIAEVFNVTNHANYGAYNGQLNTTTFGQPRQSLLNAYQPRVMQLAFKVSF